MATDDPNTEELLHRAGGDPQAMNRLLLQHRDRLRRMVALRMDRRLAARVDASDIVQEVLNEAARKLPGYLQQPRAPFYAWLRQLACQQLLDVYRRHVLAQCRSVRQEGVSMMDLPDESVTALAGRLVSSGTSPSGRAQKQETRQQVRAALARLAPLDREVLTMWYLEQLSVPEMAAIWEITEQAVRHRHRRALERLGELLGSAHPGSHRHE